MGLDQAGQDIAARSVGSFTDGAGQALGRDGGDSAVTNVDIGTLHTVIAVSYTHLDVYKRQPVREAIRLLEREGLVVYEPRKGAVARPRLTLSLIHI